MSRHLVWFYQIPRSRESHAYIFYVFTVIYCLMNHDAVLFSDQIDKASTPFFPRSQRKSVLMTKIPVGTQLRLFAGGQMVFPYFPPPLGPSCVRNHPGSLERLSSRIRRERRQKVRVTAAPADPQQTSAGHRAMCPPPNPPLRTTGSAPQRTTT